MQWRYLLFDLDGTILPMNMDLFMAAYLKAISGYMKDYLPPEQFLLYLQTATRAMIDNRDPQLTNEEVFDRVFFQLSALSKEKTKLAFADFYRREFPSLIRLTWPSPLPALILDTALKKGYRLVIATNPVFPLVAIRERLRWAGVDRFPYSLITSFENMHFCKPHPEYYQEILSLLSARPEECIMIGNDTDEDLPAGQLGLTTYLVADCLRNRNRQKFFPDYSGSLAELLHFVRNLPELTLAPQNIFN